MSTKPVRLTFLVVLALTLFVLPAAAQAGVLQLSRGEDRTVAARFQEGEELFKLVWKRLVGVWQKEGASIDPNGSPKPGQANGSDSGASIDPTGSSTSGGN